MFSGIVETQSPALSCEALDGGFRLRLQRPANFDDISTGDSISVDGVCLTVEALDEQSLTFTLAAETVRVLKWNLKSIDGKLFNLERSLRWGDRVHGHMVSGHVDSLGEIARKEFAGESLFVDVRIDPSLRSLVWPKGSIAIHGVSLTINEVNGDMISVCLIPETQKRTNLAALNVGDRVNIEPDPMARAVARVLENR